MGSKKKITEEDKLKFSLTPLNKTRLALHRFSRTSQILCTYNYLYKSYTEFHPNRSIDMEFMLEVHSQVQFVLQWPNFHETHV
jgi:hypothetical protein